MRKGSSKNIYALPFGDKLKIILRPAPYHRKNNWMVYALDFAMPNGTPILAAADGIVYLVIDIYKKRSLDKSMASKCNRIIIKHGKKEYTDYVHLKKGCEVKKGEGVEKGQVIGYSGSTGYSGYPHLHFAVMVKAKNKKWQTVVPRFKIKGKMIELESPQ